jgi:hypothetical protein
MTPPEGVPLAQDEGEAAAEAAVEETGTGPVEGTEPEDRRHRHFLGIPMA